MKKFLIVSLVLLVIATSGFLFWRKRSAVSTATPATPARPTNAVVKVRDVRFAVTAAGEIVPAEQVSVRPEVNGRIEELPVDLGDKVKKGDLLFRLDDEELQIEKSRQSTEIAGAKLQVDQNRRLLDRSRLLFDQNVISLEVYEEAKTRFELAANSLERAEKNLTLLEDRLSKTKILAPFDCTILTRPVSVGQAVSGSAGFNSGTEVLTIADLNALVINAHINQSDVTRLKVDQTVEVSVEAIANLKLPGRVERIAPQSTFKSNVKGYSARILLTLADDRVRPGMTANIRIPIASADKVLTIPLSAVFTEMGSRYVYVQKPSAIERRPVDVGISDYEFAEIRSGLSEGEIVLIEYVPSEEDVVEQPGTPPAKPTPASSNTKSVAAQSVVR